MESTVLSASATHSCSHAAMHVRSEQTPDPYQTRASTEPQNSAKTPPINKKSSFGFITATCGFVLGFIGSSMPVPLYANLQLQYPQISDTHVSLTMFAYLLGVIFVLLFSGKLSDAVGRKPLTLTSLVSGAVACVLFLFVTDAFTLLTVRFLQGISCGLGMGPVSAYIIDFAGKKHSALASTVVANFPMLGSALGSVGIGIWELRDPDATPIFLVMAALMVLAAIIVASMRETVTKERRIPLSDVVKHPLAFPKEIRSVFPYTALAYTFTWFFLTYFQSLSSLVAVECFGSESTLVAALILSLSMCPSCFSGPFEARFAQGISLRVGMTIFAICSLILCVLMNSGMLVPFLIVLVLLSLSVGMALLGSLRILFATAPDASNSSIISVINLTAYAGCSALNIGLSAIVEPLGVYGAFLATTAICVLAALVCIMMSKRSA